MKVILLNDIAKLGRKHDIKDVNSGHALNFLFPKGLAVAATPEAVKRVEGQKAKTEEGRKVQEELLVKNIDGLKDITLTIIGKANDKGHLFAGLHKEEIAAELVKQTQLHIDPSFIQLEHPIKELGEHTIEVKGAGKNVKFNLMIKAR